MSISSEEVNYLIYRYLLESGFVHTSFSFLNESNISKSHDKGSHIRPGALINLLQKGLQYLDVETHIKLDGSEVKCVAPFSIIGPHVCDIRDVNTSAAAAGREIGGGATANDKKKDDAGLKKRGRKRMRRDSVNTGSGDVMVPTESNSGEETVQKPQTVHPMKIDENEKAVVANTPTVTTTTTANPSTLADTDVVVKNENISIFTAHASEAYVCCWNPVFPLIATGSGDDTAKIWKVPENGSAEISTPISLPHNISTPENKDVMALEWDPTGTLLASGTYDGQVRIWTKEGKLKYKMIRHTGAIFGIKWNMAGTLLLTGSLDSTAVVWDTLTGEVKQQFKFHTASTLDVDWSDNETFATCSSDKTICICKVGMEKPLAQWSGHESDVNSIKWDPSHALLASCGDDRTLRIWSLEDAQVGKDPCKHVLKAHDLDIYTLRWSPKQGKEKLLATASFDSTVVVWDINQGTVRYKLSTHKDAVYTISFSPDGKYLASGAHDHTVIIWSMKDGTLVKTYKGEAVIFEVSWNTICDKVAVCYADNKVVILHLPNLP
ncbi:Transducin (beta)-like 1 X-linked receptor 1 [Nowakowskiella sp. JEL0407]|nr:Transducin (beta)-like 1 X-linked receptor 1 [Nowakowskiella sp. JEL0407]